MLRVGSVQSILPREVDTLRDEIGSDWRFEIEY